MRKARFGVALLGGLLAGHVVARALGPAVAVADDCSSREVEYLKVKRTSVPATDGDFWQTSAFSVAGDSFWVDSEGVYWEFEESER